MNQFAALVAALPGIEAVLVREGHRVPRPEYGGELEGVQDEVEHGKEGEEAENEQEGVDEHEHEHEHEQENRTPEPQQPAKKEQKTKENGTATVKPAKIARPVKEAKKSCEARDEAEEDIPAPVSASSKLARFMHS